MQFRHRLVVVGAVAAWLSVPAQAQFDQSRYEYCHQRAVEFSDYRGPVPDKYLPGGTLRGAATGSGLAALGSLLSGESKKERKKAERRGAIIGGIIGAIRRGEAKKREQRAARIYRLELDACMNAAR